jgi:hypothetical protein
MKSNYEKSYQPVTAPKSTTLNLQTRAFAPTQSDSSPVNRQSEEALDLAKASSAENLLGKLISNSFNSSSSANPIQRKLQRRFPIQAKLNIGEPNDKYEKEADDTAAKVVQQINSSPQVSVQRNESMESEDEELQMKPVISTIQRNESIEEEDEELQMKSSVQSRENIGGGEASTDLESSIQRARGSGQPLDQNLQSKMGQAMGADFSGVKVHTDSQSDQLNKSIQAKAFTTGQDVFFRQGAYEPNSQVGQELIAHELTHVVQQNGGAVQRSLHQSRTTGILSTSLEDRKIQAKAESKQNSQELSEERQPNQTGLPDTLKSGVESLSGISMDNVNVHYNSSAPAQFGALAYTQGSDIHVAPGQEEHLPHEAWHVVQQAQGRVKPTMQMKDDINVNASEGLEHEADVMGRKATQQSNFLELLTPKLVTKQGVKESPHQFKLPMKDSGPAERTNGSGPKLMQEVTATISRGDRTEIESDIRKLETSIQNRTSDQKGRDKNSIEYGNHQARIELEEKQLTRLRDKLKTLPKPKYEKPKGVVKKEPKPTSSSNMFAALGDMEDSESED